jgi:hypothetical protein
MYRHRAFVPLATAVITACAWFSAPFALGRKLGAVEALVVAGASFAALAWWRARRFRLERQQTESMRDSALW